MSDATSQAHAGLPRHRAWFRFARGGVARLGAVDPTGAAPRWFDLGPVDVVALLRDGALTRDDLAARIAGGAEMPAPERFLPPVPRGGNILCLAKNYVAHAREFGAEAPAEPIFFAKLPGTLVAHGDEVAIPHWLETRVDHEAELALVLGFADPQDRGAKHVTEATAPALVRGYTTLNDVTARKLQGQDREQKYPWLRAKAIDTFCPTGPFVTPSDAIDASDLRVVMRVNGEVRQDARTSAMVFPVAQALAAMSRVTTLRPGDLIAMGTPEGVSPVVPGDVMEVEVEGLGVLRNPVVKEPAQR
ncbi:MAG: fumarylacetoacetate hydrolase family protein [Planctomycetes bacterium]|nr:fumarylacetoacetate hydrolase family protein [Planctomycetota bacterium]